MDQLHVVKLDGRLTVERIVAIKDTLLKQLEAHDNLVVDCGGATDIDVSFLQLLYAANRACESRGNRLSLAGRCPEPMRKVLRDAGFCHAGDACIEDPADCLWRRKVENKA